MVETVAEKLAPYEGDPMMLDFSTEKCLAFYPSGRLARAEAVRSQNPQSFRQAILTTSFTITSGGPGL